VARHEPNRASRAFAVAALMSLGVAALAEPSERTATVIIRALSYNRELSPHAEAVVIALLYKKNNAASEADAEGWSKAFHKIEQVKLQGHSVVTVKLEFDDGLTSFLGGRGVDVLLVCDGLDGEADKIKTASRSQKVVTVGSKEEYVRNGMSLGVFAEGNRNNIVINLPASKAEGAGFSSDLLRLATVIQ